LLHNAGDKDDGGAGQTVVTPSYPTKLGWLKAKLRCGLDRSSERRTARRERLTFKAEIDGPAGSVQAKGVDINAQGAMVVSRQAWAIGTKLFTRIKDLKLGGIAEVRHCTERKDGSFAVGLEFRGPFTTQAGTWRIQRIYTEDGEWTTIDDYSRACGR
jgi:hypothetical protein